MGTHRAVPGLLVLLCLSVTCFFTVTCSTQGNDDPLEENGVYPYHEQLDDNYGLQWKFNSTHIMFHVKVKAVGWVGFGISVNGDMYPGDMVIAWMSGETVHFQDRYAKEHAMPSVDKHQDWHLIEYKREDDLYNTTFTVIRKLDTCDEEEDIPISQDTTRVIYAYSDLVPESDHAVLYHGPIRRGSKSVLFLDPPSIGGAIGKLPGDVITVDILNQNYSVPGTDTTYACNIMKFPRDLKEKHHLIRFEPKIQEGHENLVHHMLLYYCIGSVPEEYLNTPYVCYEEERLKKVTNNQCIYAMLAWAVGGTAFNYPPHAGLPLGTPEDPIYYRLEIHYNNVQMRRDYVDSSGLRVFLTKELRQHDAGVLTVGIVEKGLVIPPYIDSFLTRAYCPQECIEQAVGDGNITVFADLLHSHLLGRRMVTRHIRDGVELPPIMTDDHYDFNYQQTRALREERSVKKTDMLITDCYYDSSKRPNVTYGGPSTHDEMCLSIMLYYPRSPLNSCGTRLLDTKDKAPMYPDGGVASHVHSTNWTLKNNREDFVKNVRQSDVMDVCLYHNMPLKMIHTTQPVEFEVYVPEVTCEKKVNGAAGSTTSLPGRGVTSSSPNALLVYLSACLFSALLYMHTRC